MKNILLILLFLGTNLFSQKLVDLKLNYEDKQAEILIVCSPNSQLFTNYVILINDSIIVAGSIIDRDNANIGINWTCKLINGKINQESDFILYFFDEYNIPHYKLIRDKNSKKTYLEKLSNQNNGTELLYTKYFNISQNEASLTLTKKIDFLVNYINIFDLQGKPIFSINSDAFYYYFDIANLSIGIYFAFINIDEGKNILIKIVKNR